MPSAPFTMRICQHQWGREDRKVFGICEYSKKYGRPGAEVDKEIDERLNIKNEEEKVCKRAPKNEGGFMSMIKKK